MSNLSSPAKSSIKLSGQQGKGSQGGFSGSSSGTSGSSLGASGSKTQQSSIGQASGSGGNGPSAVIGAETMVDLNRSIRTYKPYDPNKTVSSRRGCVTFNITSLF